MAQQLKLPIEAFDELLDCPLKYDDYIKNLKENKFVS